MSHSPSWYPDLVHDMQGFLEIPWGELWAHVR